MTLAQPWQRIYLLWHEAHFYGVLSVTDLFDESFFCEDCLVLCRHKNDHKCGGCCLRCYSNTCHNDLGLPLIRCNDCARYFIKFVMLVNQLKIRTIIVIKVVLGSTNLILYIAKEISTQISLTYCLIRARLKRWKFLCKKFMHITRDPCIITL